MSVAEMKLAAIYEIGKLQDEQAVKEILDHLTSLDKEINPSLTALEHAAAVIKERSSVLEKLAR